MIPPTQDYRRTGYHAPDKPLKGIDARVHGLIGVYHRRPGLLTQLRRDAEQVDLQAPHWKAMATPALHEKLIEFRAGFRRGGEGADQVLLPALAAIREAADRQVGLRPFVVQLMGALALHRGYLAEMATGEGKTLTAGLAAVLAGWTKHPTHIVTVNDYLVERDAEWLRQLYHFCGVRVGCVTAAMPPADRAKGYGCDVTYTTSKELLADFLRDRLRLGTLQNPTRRLIRRLLQPRQTPDGLVMRGLHTAIIDEADSILIDEAVTPLIISSPHKNELLKEAGRIAHDLIADLKPGTDYHLNPRYREIELTDSGKEKVADRCTRLPGMWKGSERRLELIRQALVAREFFHRGKQYIISEEHKVVIVDEFTGRPMPQRTWREGMHQAIEAKEGIEISDPSETIARLSFQRFFRCFHQLSGMTGTGREASTEFWQAYKLPVITIPTNKPCIRTQRPDRIFADDEAKWTAVADAIEQEHATGRPILVGTRSVAASEKLADLLKQRNLEFRLLNAVRLQEEAQIIALAGERAHITIATNMAGRGTDIKLGNGVAELGGLHVIATERHESGRVDRQLFGRSARQGDPGSAQAFVSADDELLTRHLPRSIRALLKRSLRTRLPAHRRLARSTFTLAQHKAQALAYKQRATVLRTDNWLDDALSFAGAET